MVQGYIQVIPMAIQGATDVRREPGKTAERGSVQAVTGAGLGRGQRSAP